MSASAMPLEPVLAMMAWASASMAAGAGGADRASDRARAGSMAVSIDRARGAASPYSPRSLWQAANSALLRCPDDARDPGDLPARQGTVGKVRVERAHFNRLWRQPHKFLCHDF